MPFAVPGHQHEAKGAIIILCCLAPQPSPFTSYLSSLPILQTPSRSSLPNVLECSPGNFALASPGFGG